MGQLQLEKYDFFDIKLLDKKQGTFYVRDGKVFIYTKGIKINVDPEHPSTHSIFGNNGKVGVVEDLEFNKLEIKKNVKVEGFFWLWQSEEWFCLVFFDNLRKHSPVLLRAGNALESLEN